MSSAGQELSRRRRTAEGIREYWIDRIHSQVRFAGALARRIPELSAEDAIEKATTIAAKAIDGASTTDLPAIVADAEAALAPLASTA